MGVTAEGRPLIVLLLRPDTSPSLEGDLSGASPCLYSPPAMPVRSSLYIFRTQLFHGSDGPLPGGKLKEKL